MKRGSIYRFFRLVGFECRKSFGNYWMLLFLVGMLLLNGWKILDSYREKTREWETFSQQYQESYELYGGTITAEKVGALMEVYAPLEQKFENMTLDYSPSDEAYTYSEGLDEEFYRTLFVTELKYDYYYQNNAVAAVNRAVYLSELYDQVGNTYAAQKNAIIARDFLGRSIPQFADSRGYEVLLGHDYSTMLILLLTVFALCGSFVTERETDMVMLLRTTPNGGGLSVAAKLVSGGIFIIAISALFYAQDFLSIYLAGGRNQLLYSPVYALVFLERTPLRCTVGEYFLLSFGLRTLGSMGFGCLILLVSSLCRQVLTSFFVSFGVVLAAVALQSVSHGRYLLKWCNPMELILCREVLCREDFVNVFGAPVRGIVFVTLGVVGVMILGAVGIVLCNRSYHRTGRRGRRAA